MIPNMYKSSTELHLDTLTARKSFLIWTVYLSATSQQGRP